MWEFNIWQEDNSIWWDKNKIFNENKSKLHLIFKNVFNVCIQLYGVYEHLSTHIS